MNSPAHVASAIHNLDRRLSVVERSNRLENSSLRIDGKTITMPETARTARDAAATAETKSTLTWSVDGPPTPASNGDTWFKQEATNGPVESIWRYQDGVWESYVLQDAVLGSVSAAKIATGSLQAGTQIHAGPLDGAHATISAHGITTYGSDGTTALVRLGTGVNDRLAVSSDTGDVVAAITSDGAASFARVSADTYTINQPDPAKGRTGGDVASWFERRPRGIAAFGGRYFDSQAHSGEHGVYEIGVTMQRGRTYKITTSNHRVDTKDPGSLVVMRMRMETTPWIPQGDPVPAVPRPTNDSFLLCETIGRSSNEGITGLNLFRLIQWSLDPNDSRYGDTLNMRLRVSLATFGANTSTLVTNKVADNQWASPAEIAVEDAGPAVPNYVTYLDGDGASAPEAEPPQTYQLTEKAAWVSTFRGDGSLRTDTTDAVQGQSSFAPQNGNHRAFVGFPDLTNRLNGAQIKSVELFLKARHTEYGTGGDAVLGTHGVTERPTTHPGGWFDRKRRHFDRGEGAWWDISDMEPQGWASGAVRGVTLGQGPTADGLYYLRFDGADSAPLIRITYVK